MVHQNRASSVIKLHRYHQLSKRYLKAIGISPEELLKARMQWLKAGSIRSFNRLISSVVGLVGSGASLGGLDYLGSSIVGAAIDGALPVGKGISRIFTDVSQHVMSYGGIPTVPENLQNAQEFWDLTQSIFKDIQETREQCNELKNTILKSPSPFSLNRTSIEKSLRALEEKEKQLEMDRKQYRHRSALINGYLISKSTQVPVRAAFSTCALAASTAIPGAGAAVGAGISLGSVFLQMPFSALDHHNYMSYLILAQTKYGNLIQSNYKETPIAQCTADMLDERKICGCWLGHAQLLQNLCLEVIQHKLSRTVRKIDRYETKLQSNRLSPRKQHKTSLKREEKLCIFRSLTRQYDLVKSGRFRELEQNCLAYNCLINQLFLIREGVKARANQPLELANQTIHYAAQSTLVPAASLLITNTFDIAEEFSAINGFDIASTATSATGKAVSLANNPNNSRQKSNLRKQVEKKSLQDKLEGRVLCANYNDRITPVDQPRKVCTKTIQTDEGHQLHLVTSNNRLAKKAMGKKEYAKTLGQYAARNIFSPISEPASRISARAMYDTAARAQQKIHRTQARLKYLLEENESYLPTISKKKSSSVDLHLQRSRLRIQANNPEKISHISFHRRNDHSAILEEGNSDPPASSSTPHHLLINLLPQAQKSTETSSYKLKTDNKNNFIQQCLNRSLQKEEQHNLDVKPLHLQRYRAFRYRPRRKPLNLNAKIQQATQTTGHHPLMSFSQKRMARLQRAHASSKA